MLFIHFITLKMICLIPSSFVYRFLSRSIWLYNCLLQTCSYMICKVRMFLFLTWSAFAFSLSYWIKWIHVVVVLPVHSLYFGMLSRLACFAVRERFACKEILDKHERSLWLVAGHLVAGSPHGDQAEAALLLALVLHNVATHLSGALKSSVSSYYHNIEMITTKCKRKKQILFRLKNVCIDISVKRTGEGSVE